MAKKPKRYTTTRAVYKDVKKFDHGQFDDFCSNVYAQGIEDGRASVPGVDLTRIMEEVRKVKGIGEKRMAQIEAAVAVLFPEDGGEDERRKN